MNDKINKVCGMCTHSRPVPESKRVFCGRYPPQIIQMMRVNVLTKQPETMDVSVLPDALNEIVCGEFEYEHGGIKEHVDFSNKNRGSKKR